MRIAQAEGKNWRKELVHYLAKYRTTPHTVTGVCPAELLFGRKIRTKMPEFRETTVNDGELRDRAWEKNIKAMTYVDERRGAQANDLQTGDQVLLKKKNQTSCQPNLKVSLTKSSRRRAIVSLYSHLRNSNTKGTSQK